MIREERWLRSLLEAVSIKSHARFSGLGIMVYEPPLRLPVCSLVPEGQLPVSNSGNDIESISSFLAGLSDVSGRFHDGFHLVGSRDLTVTHACQYVAPPIPSTLPAAIPDRPVGARFMTALLASLIPSVVAVGTLSATSGTKLFRHGQVQSVDIDRR